VDLAVALEAPVLAVTEDGPCAGPSKQNRRNQGWFR
jgi:hypothetical protein